MEPFHQIFPDATDPVMTLTLAKKTGAIPKGSYGFIECYCTDPGCDCRRVLILVLDLKMKQKAAISFGFDQRGVLDGPSLVPSPRKLACAPELLDFFVQALNSGAEWLERIYGQYRAVREKVDGKRYRGKAFPKPGKLEYRVPSPPDPEGAIERSLQELLGLSGGTHAARGRKRVSSTGEKRGAGATRGNFVGGGEQGMASLVDRYAGAGTGGSIATHTFLQDELRLYLLENGEAGEELASLLPVLCQQSPEDDERIDAALRVLFDALDILRLELERQRPAATVLMEQLQSALARHIFLENEDLDLCAAVSHILLQSRVEILPVLREANSRMMQSGAARADLQEEPGEEMMAGIAKSLAAMGLDSPFEGVEAMLQLFALNDPEVQTALIAEMLVAADTQLREISALMLFHPDAGVRLGVARLLGELEGERITPDTLRRLIVTRNWFPEEIRREIDRAVTCARKARVACAPMAKRPAITVYASTIDGAGAQSFQVIVRDGKGYFSCSVLLKQGVGVADAFVVSLSGKRELNDFLAMLRDEASFLESNPEYLDQRLCHALADGVRFGNAPNYWLVRIAELLGSDRWQTVPFDAEKELHLLREQIANLSGALLDGREYQSAMADATDWLMQEPILSSWFEDDDAVDREIEAARGSKKSIGTKAAVGRILEGVLEKRRPVWLERLVLTTLWLKSSGKAPIPWYRMFHLAAALADRALPLQEVPLMVGVAQLSFDASLERARMSRPGRGGKR